MADLQFSDSFEYWSTTSTTNAHDRWSALSVINDVTIGSSYGRNGNGAKVRSGNMEVGISSITGDLTSGNGGSGMLEKRLAGVAETEWTIGLGFRYYGTLGVLNIPIVQLIDTDYITSNFGTYYQAQCSLILTPQQRLIFHKGDYLTWPAGIIGGYSPPLRRGVYYFLEVHIVLASAATGSVRLKIDGKTVIDQSNVITIGGSGSNAKGFRILHPKMIGWSFGFAVREYHIDDVYAITGSGVSVGDIKVESHLPSADGAVHQWTPSSGASSAAMVDDTISDSASTTITTSAGNIDTYTFPTLATSAGTVHGVGINVVGKNDTGTVTVSGVTRQSASNYVTTAKTLSNTEYAGVYCGNKVNPATSAVYSVSEVNTDEFGVKRET